MSDIQQPGPWPIKTAICLECRTMVQSGDHCGEGDHHTTELSNGRERERLTAARWYRSLDGEERRSVVQTYLITGVLALLCAGLVVLTARTDSIMVTLLSMIAFAALGPVAILVGLQRLSMRSFQDSEHRPLGAVAPAPLLLDGRSVTGVVVAGDSLPAPVSERDCVAYSIGLHHRGARPSTLIASDAACCAFTIRTDAGDTIDVPAGTLVLLGNRDPLDPDPDRLRDYLSRLGLIGARGERLLDFEEIRQLRLRLGDRVAVYGQLRAELDPRGEPENFREPPPNRLLPVGTPKLERIGRR